MCYVIIMITPFDLFGYGLYRYTFQMLCKEKSELELSDGATRVFLNSRGTRGDMVDEELIELLHYMEETTDQVAQASKSERIKKLHERVKILRSNEDLEVKYMQTWEEKAMEREEGRREGQIETRKEIIKKLRENLSVKEIAELLGMTEKDVDLTL